ncbi:DUF1990 family protein [Nocardia sp. NPDC056100]|uniref:DUF1990 family protein n=1 Tax=Nocardia sp. NPDC056100 TaxID=3345712 RepID=UPI0035DC2291
MTYLRVVVLPVSTVCAMEIHRTTGPAATSATPGPQPGGVDPVARVQVVVVTERDSVVFAREGQDVGMSYEQAMIGFTYPDVGATRGEFPSGYSHFVRRRVIGAGRSAFDEAAGRVLAYQMQRGAGVFDSASTVTAEPGTELTVRLSWGPVRITAPCRVVYVVDEVNRQGFAYGTLPGHPLIGEEVFTVEFDPADGSVYGVVAAFSRRGAWYARVGGPIVRIIQRRYVDRYISAVSSRGR